MTGFENKDIRKNWLSKTTLQHVLKALVFTVYVHYNNWGIWYQLPNNYIYTPYGHQMETFSALLAICAGNSPVLGEFPVQRPVTQNFDVFFDLRLNKRVNNHGAGDLRRHRAHYDATVMVCTMFTITDTVIYYAIFTLTVYSLGNLWFNYWKAKKSFLFLTLLTKYEIKLYTHGYVSNDIVPDLVHRGIRTLKYVS